MITSFLSSTATFLSVDGTSMLLLRFAMNFFFVYIIIGVVFSRISKQREHMFSMYMINILIFFVSSLLADTKVKAGFAFGLFAIFSILRYRTVQINIKQMTFLFTCIIIAVINSLVTASVPMIQIIIANCAIVGFIAILEIKWLSSRNEMTAVVYDDISLIVNDRRDDLIADLRKRTGLKVTEFEVIKINYLQDSAELNIYYEP